jgi:hypothetical protein
VKDLGPTKDNFKRFYDLTEDDLEMTHEIEESKDRMRRRKQKEADQVEGGQISHNRKDQDDSDLVDDSDSQ